MRAPGKTPWLLLLFWLGLNVQSGCALAPPDIFVEPIAPTDVTEHRKNDKTDKLRNEKTGNSKKKGRKGIKGEKSAGSSSSIATKKGQRTPTPTSAPTRLRTQSNHPTQSPMVSTIPPSSLPSLAPITTGAPSRTVEKSNGNCFTENNLFGSADGDPRFLEYGYEVETNPESSTGTLSTVVLPPLEVAFNNFLLPTVFPQLCNNLFESRRRLLRVVGLSAVPSDEPQPEITCTMATKPGNSCFFVRGSLILFADQEDQDMGAVNQLVRDRLKLGMDSDAFLSAHSSIVRVTYVDTGSNGLPTNGEGLEDKDDADKNLVLPIALASAAVFLMAIGIVVSRRYGVSSPE